MSENLELLRIQIEETKQQIANLKKESKETEKKLISQVNALQNDISRMAFEMELKIIDNEHTKPKTK